MKYTISLLLFIFTLNANAQNNVTIKADTIFISEDMDNKSGTFYTKDKGNILIISLTEISSTGYAWSKISKPSRLLLFINDKYSSGKSLYDNGQSIAGVPGKRLFFYKITGKRGTVKLKFGYQRPWMKNIPPEKTFTYTVKVKRFK